MVYSLMWAKKYNFDNLSQQDIEALIEDKIQKNIDKVLQLGRRRHFSWKSVGDAQLLLKVKSKLS
jgi:hypothetical protein